MRQEGYPGRTHSSKGSEILRNIAMNRMTKRARIAVDA